jgi:alpha-beta hydrolase superfamily lysophospholipase
MVANEEMGQLHSVVAGDGMSLVYRFFPAPADALRGVVIHLHGIQSHGAWYVDTAAVLARHGYSVYLSDRRGSGLNPGHRGYISSRHQLLDDLQRLVEISASDHPGLPTVLIGSCWGAKLALAYALQAPERLAGLVLISPALAQKVDLRLSEKLKVAVGHVVAPRLQVRVPLTPEMFTTNPDYLQFIQEDPLSLRTVTARFYFETFLWDRSLIKQRNLTLPLLVMQSGKDPIVDQKQIQRWFDQVASPNKQFMLYPDFGHLLDFEDRRQQYWDDLLSWLNVLNGVGSN